MITLFLLIIVCVYFVLPVAGVSVLASKKKDRKMQKKNDQYFSHPYK